MEIKILRRVPARWRGGAGSSPLDGATLVDFHTDWDQSGRSKARSSARDRSSILRDRQGNKVPFLRPASLSVSPSSLPATNHETCTGFSVSSIGLRIESGRCPMIDGTPRAPEIFRWPSLPSDALTLLSNLRNTSTAAPCLARPPIRFLRHNS